MDKIPAKEEPLKKHKFYDISGIKKHPLKDFKVLNNAGFSYKKLINKEVKFFTDGIRAQKFGLKNIWLTKMPLIFNDNSVKPVVHQHFSNNVVVADINTVLFHYKFIHDFSKRVGAAVKKAIS